MPTCPHVIVLSVSRLLLLQRECKDCHGKGYHCRKAKPFYPLIPGKLFIKSRLYKLIHSCICLMNSEP